MPSLINRGPAGLLSLLDIKAQGQNPDQLSDVVFGSVDLTPRYALYKRQAINITLDRTTIGFSSIAPVPNDQIWRVINFGISVATPAAGDLLQFSLCSFPKPLPIAVGTAAYYTNVCPMVSLGLGGKVEAGASYLPAPVWLQPSEILSLAVWNVSTAAAHCYFICAGVVEVYQV